jgi:exosome complex RNA-binding protein Rrp42 (RNase PH superfamily)
MAPDIQKEEEIQSCPRERTAAGTAATTTTTTTTTAPGASTNATTISTRATGATGATSSTTNTSYTAVEITFRHIPVGSITNLVDKIAIFDSRYCEYHLYNFSCLVSTTKEGSYCKEKQ